MNVYFHVFHKSGADDIQNVWDFYRREKIVTAGYKSDGPDAGKKMLAKYESGDEILVYAKSYGLVGYAKMDKDKESAYRNVDNPIKSLNNPIDHSHIMKLKYIRWEKDVEKAITYENICSTLRYEPGLRRWAFIKCKAKEYDYIQDLIEMLPKAKPVVSPPVLPPPKGKDKKTYKDFGDAPNDDSDELQQFAARVRRGQPKFRETLLKAYEYKCSISGHGPKEVLEAVHIEPHAKTGINELDNGLLMRCDLHSLFDANLLRVNPRDLSVSIDSSLKKTPYWEFQGKNIRKKADGTSIGTKYLKQRWKRTK